MWNVSELYEEKGGSDFWKKIQADKCGDHIPVDTRDQVTQHIWALLGWQEWVTWLEDTQQLKHILVTININAQVLIIESKILKAQFI